MPKVKRPSIFLGVGPAGRQVLEGRVTVPQTFLARFDAGTRVGTVDVVVETIDGRSRIVELNVKETPGRGLRGVTVGALSAQELLDSAVEAATFVAPTSELAATVQTATRRRVTDLRLAEVADAYLRGGIDGVVALGVSERHAWRLKKRAVEAGLIEMED